MRTSGGTDADRTGSGSAIRVCLLLDLAAVAAVILAQVSALGGAGADAGDWGRAPLRTALASAGLLAIVAAGAVGGYDLIRRPFASRTGRLAAGLAVFNVVLLPVVWLVSHIVRLFGPEFHVGWGMPYFPFWIASGLGALVASLIDAEERPRAVLVFAVVFGAATLTFFLGDMVPN